MAEPIAIGWPECGADGLTLIWDSAPTFIKQSVEPSLDLSCNAIG